MIKQMPPPNPPTPGAGPSATQSLRPPSAPPSASGEFSLPTKKRAQKKQAGTKRKPAANHAGPSGSRKRSQSPSQRKRARNKRGDGDCKTPS